MKNLDKAIATAGIWIGVGLSSLGVGFGAVFIAIFACLATTYVWGD